MTGPLYRQIADQLRHMIESGELKAGLQIYTEDQLMEQFHASRNTVRNALRELTTRGLVYTLHGKGTFVCEPVAPIVITLTSDPETGRGGGLEARAPRLLDTSDIAEGAVAYLAEVGIRQDGYQDSIEWRAPDQGETTYFDLPQDGHVQVVEIRRVAFDQNGSRIRLTITIYRADRSRFVVNDGNVPRSARGQL